MCPLLPTLAMCLLPVRRCLPPPLPADFPDLILPTAELRLSAWLEDMQEAVDSSTSKLAAVIDKLQRDTAAGTGGGDSVGRAVELRQGGRGGRRAPEYPFELALTLLPAGLIVPTNTQLQ
jgi:hypothetical protein